MGQDCAVGEVAFFGTTCFFCSVILTLTGTGSATIFQLLFALASATGLLNCADIKYAVFLQTVSAASTVPFIIYKSKDTWSRDLNFFLVSMMTPSIAMGSNLGQIIQVAISVPVLEIVCGGLLVAFALQAIWESRSKFSAFICSIIRPTAADEGELPVDAATQAEEGGATEEDGEESETVALITDVSRSDSKSGDTKGDLELQPVGGIGESSSGSDSAIACLEENGDDLVTTDAAAAAASSGTDVTQTNAHLAAAWARFVSDFKSVSLLGALAAFAAGFFGGVLGGLTGIRAPPVLIYFMYSGYGKEAIRSTNVTIGLASLLVRLIFYAMLPDTASGGKASWFSLDDWPLYLATIVFSIAGVPAGHKLYGMVDAESFRVILAFLLILAGIAMLGPGIRDIASSL